MEIVDKRVEPVFKNVLVGNIFEWEGEFYLRIDTVTSNKTHSPVNAIVIRNGALAHFTDLYKVKLINRITLTLE